MKALHSKTILSQRSTVPKARPVSQRIRKLYTTGLPKRLLRGKQEKAQEQIQINDGLAICLFGFSTQAQKQQIKVSEQVSTQPSSKKQLNMYDLLAHEEELRQQTVMAVSAILFYKGYS